MEQQHPLISVIIPFFNVEEYLGAAIESVLAQSYTNWHLVLVDDGSVDGSRELARSFCERFPTRISCVSHEGNVNRGASASRNLGRVHSRGSHIAYLDSDDLWTPDKLERQVAILRRFPDVGMIVGATRYWHSWTGRPEDAGRDARIPVGGPQDTICFPPDLVRILYPLGKGNAPSVNTILVRTDVVDLVGGWEDQFRVAYEDQAFLIKIYFRATVYISSEWWDFYRQRPGSNSSSELVGERRNKHKYAFLKWLESYMRAEQLDSSEEWQLVRNALRRLRRFRYPLLASFVRAVRRVVSRAGSSLNVQPPSS